MFEQVFSFADDFLSQSISPLGKHKRSLSPTSSGAAASSKKPRMELQRELPKLYTAMEREMATVKGEAAKALVQGQLAWTVARTVDVEFVNPAFEMYVKTLTAKMVTQYRFLGDSNYMSKIFGDTKFEESRIALPAESNDLADALVVQGAGLALVVGGDDAASPPAQLQKRLLMYKKESFKM